MWLQFEPIRRAQVLDGAFTRGDWCSEETNTAYCLRSSTSLAVRPAISPMERRMSSLSLGSSHRSAMRFASASSARMFSSPSGPPWGSASQAWKNIQIFLSTSRALHRFLESQREQNLNENRWGRAGIKNKADAQCNSLGWTWIHVLLL